MKNSKVCVVVAVFNRKDVTIRFIESFHKVSYQNYTIVIFDDGSKDGLSEYLHEHYPEIVILKGDGNYWWSGATNEGVKYAIANGYDYVLTINNDSEVEPNFLTHMVETAESNPGSIVGARVMYPDRKMVWSMGVTIYFHSYSVFHLNSLKHPFDNSEYKSKLIEVQALPGNGVLIPVNVFKKIGLYDAKWFPQYHGDSEFTYRATRAGIKNYLDLNAVVYNHEYVGDPKFSLWDELSSKRSPHYWRPVVKFYYKYASWVNKIFVLRQFTWIPKKIIKKLLH